MATVKIYRDPNDKANVIARSEEAEDEQCADTKEPKLIEREFKPMIDHNEIIKNIKN